MLNSCVKVLWRCRLLKTTHINRALQNYATFGVNDILYETSDEAGTLQTRFAKHVAIERSKICEQVPNTVKFANYFPITDIRYFQNELNKTDKEQLSTVALFAFTYRPNADPHKFATILNDLDRHATRNLQEMKADTILRTLYAFQFLIPNWVTRLDFYGLAMKHLSKEFNTEEKKSKEMFVQVCFYLGLSKKHLKFDSKSLLSSLLEAHLDRYIPEMSTLDIALVSNAAYKTSVLIKSSEFNQRLVKEVLDISNPSHGNDGILITFIKSMRLQRLRSPQVCKYIENISQDSEKFNKLQTKGQIHLFAYLAESLWDSKACTQSFIESIANKFAASGNNKASYSEMTRGKDISTFLWACTQLNCILSPAQIQNIHNIVLGKCRAGEFNNFADHLVECCLWLWFLGHRNRELLHAAVSVKSQSDFKPKQPKVDSRLSVLLSAAQIEEPKMCSDFIKTFKAFDENAKLPNHLLSDQQLLPYQNIIDELKKEETVATANITCPINGINIPGIRIQLTSQADSQIYLELLTPTQTLHFSKQPFGILRLKLRLLRALGHKVKLLTLTDALNPEFLKNAINDCKAPEEIINESCESTLKA